MALDAGNTDMVAGGAFQLPPPIMIEGLNLLPPVQNLCSQVTGDGITKFFVRITKGRARIVDFLSEFATDEYTVVDYTTENRQYDQGTLDLTSGKAVWFAAVAVQHKPNRSIDIVFVPGAIADVASAVVPTEDAILTRLGDNIRYAIIGDVMFHRSADTIIQVRVTEERRAAYVDADNKDGVVYSQGSVSSLESKFLQLLTIPADLASMSAVADGGLYIDGIPLPNLPFGGFIKGWRYVPVVAGAGAGADISACLALDGTNVTNGNLNLLLANTAIASGVEDYTGLATNVFKSGDKLDVKVLNTPTNFSGGSGVFVVELWEYIQ